MQHSRPDRTKELGQFFTPAYIAQFIVQKTIGQYLGDKIDNQKMEVLVLDPSVGEGIFLVTAKKFLKGIWETQSQKNSSSSEIDKQIVVNQLYGIDIDPKKVQMTRDILGYSNYKENIKTFDALLPSSGIVETTKESILLGWNKNFPNTTGKFHIIIGNPPWGADISEIKSQLRYLRSATSQMDSWSLFLERSLIELRDDGYLGFVVPNTLLINSNYKKIREIILDQCQIDHLVNLGEGIFPGVTQPSLIVILRKCQVRENHSIHIIPRITNEEKELLDTHQKELENCKFFKCPQSRFQKNLNKEFDIFAGSNTSMIQIMEKDLHSEQKQVTTLSTLVMNGRGVEIGKKGKATQCPGCGMWNAPPRTKRKCVNSSCNHFLSPNDVHSEIVYDLQLNPTYDRPFLAGYQIQRYFTYEHRFINTNCQGINYKSPELYQGPKLLLRKTGNTMNWVIDYQSRWVSQVVYIFKRREDLQPIFENVTQEYLLGLLNSQLMMRYIQSKFFDPERTDFPHFVQNSILNLPIRIPNTEILKKKAQKIGKLALQLQELYQEAYLKSSHIKHQENLQERINRVEEEIEQSVEFIYSNSKDTSYI